MYKIQNENWRTSLSCRRCEHLPPLGKLPYLKILDLWHMDALKHIDNEVYGDDESAFPSLESLSRSNMDNLEEWATVAERNMFPRLGKLYVNGYKDLVDLPVIPSVRRLEIEGESEMLLSSVHNFPFLTTLKISGFHNMRDFPAGLLHNHTVLENLEIFYMESLKSLANELENLSALKVLNIEQCYELKSLPEVNGFCGVASLRSLHIEWCNKFTSLSEGVRYLTALEDLNVWECSELNSLPKSISHLIALQRLTIGGSKRLSSLPNEIGCLTSLQQLEIDYCPDLTCLPQGVQNLKKLRVLRIRACTYLERRCQKERGEDWPKIAHIPYIYINFQLIQALLTPPSFAFVSSSV
ncbi:hypothetical protein JCGZ_13021 [Jatropha curcas]|uniref:Disease resistance R13L4/SHOC-2-like LRR domain-containing protein n=1 Tax=Jatropha curcas TaxID=180498 RepID=A0A067KL41_JATCU|nr:hypothetical protein JCGZ_13021 [Jatropha curcas]